MPASLRSNKRAVLALLCTTEFMIALDFSIMNVALPSLQTALHFSQGSLQWVVSAYALTFGGFLMLGGRVADVYGRRLTLICGLLFLAVTSMIAGFSQSAEFLVILRSAQGIGAAFIAPAALALLTTAFAEPHERQAALGAWGSVLGAGFISGVILGGVITEFLGWRWVLFVNVPIAIVVAMLAPILLTESRADGDRRRLDLPGALLITSGIIALVFMLSHANEAGWLSPSTIGVGLLAVALVAGFLFAEGRAKEPLVPLSFFRLRAVMASNAVNVLIIGAFTGVIFVITLFLQQVGKYSPLQTGLTFALAGVAGLTGGAVAGRLASRIAVRLLLAVAAVGQAVAALVLLTLPLNHTAVLVVAGTIVLNFSDVLGIVMVNIAATSGVPADRQGLAGGLLNTSQQVGAGLGLAVVAAVVTARTPAVRPDSAGLITGFRWGLTTAIIISVLAAVLALMAMPAPSPEPSPEDEQPQPAPVRKERNLQADNRYSSDR